MVYERIKLCADGYLRNGGIFESMGCGSIRGMLYWGYQIAVKIGEIEPIENSEDKISFWEEALKWELSKEERIKLAKGLYFLASRYQSF
jgi:hypothetical protein